MDNTSCGNRSHAALNNVLPRYAGHTIRGNPQGIGPGRGGWAGGRYGCGGYGHPGQYPQGAWDVPGVQGEINSRLVRESKKFMLGETKFRQDQTCQDHLKMERSIKLQLQQHLTDQSEVTKVHVIRGACEADLQPLVYDIQFDAMTITVDEFLSRFRKIRFPNFYAETLADLRSLGQKSSQNIMSFYNEFRNLHLALERGNVDEFIDDFIEKLENPTVRHELITKTYATGTRTLACVASHADTIAQNLRLHGKLEVKDSSSAAGAVTGGRSNYGRKDREFRS